MFCVLMIGGISTAEAVHIHGQWVPKNTAHLTTPADAAQGQGEEHCPLCVAMHSALPVSLQVVPEPVEEVAQALTAHTLAVPEKLWSFAMFSRPPPSAARTLAAGGASNDALLAVTTAG